MNKQDNKLFQIINGFNLEYKKSIISFSLDPETYKKMKHLKKSNVYLAYMLNDWIENLQIKDYTLNCINDYIDVDLNKYKHKNYRFNSFYIDTKNKKKIKIIAAINNVTVSSMIRLFLSRL